MAHLSKQQAKALQGFLVDMSLTTRSSVNVSMPAKPTSANSVGNRADGKPHVSTPTRISISDVIKDEMAEGEGAGYESEEGGVKRWLIDAPHKARKITERKRADAAAFAVELEKDFKKFTDHDNTPLGDQEKSLTWLVRDFESEKIIASPRDYQLELFQKAKLQNTIAVLDTGRSSLYTGFCGNDAERY
jgi:endoribonuclease Dicer